MKNNKFELMAPAGSFPSFIAASKAGADAIYLGLNDFSMRQGKNNFKVSDLDKLRKISDSYPRKPKIYVTLNTIVYDSEIKKLEKLIIKIKNKVDAIICWDFAVISLCKKYKVPFFISTQASISNKDSALFYKKLGAKRVVLARELDLKQVKETAKIKNLEIEVFIHGAMCVSVSGRCFTSQFFFNKSANRGECLQPCRRSYLIKDKITGKELELDCNKVMSAKDLCTLHFIEDLKKIGVKSFKIEGRNRDPRYVDVVTRVYRKSLDNKLNKEEIANLMKELDSVYNRGFSSGFYLGKPTPKDFSEVENSASKTYREFLGNVVHIYKKVNVVAIKLSNNIKKGDSIVITDNKIGIEGVEVEKMEIENKEVDSAKKGDTIGIKLPFKVSKNAEVYKLKIRK